MVDWKNKKFVVKVILDENTDDVWNFYNLIAVGDFIQGSARRKVTKEFTTGKIVNKDKWVFVLLQIKSVEYNGDVDIIRINGINMKENKDIAMGQHQSIDIRPEAKYSLIKFTFDSMHVKKLKMAAAQGN